MSLFACSSVAHAEAVWPSWRGPMGTGSGLGNPPVTWSESENVKWKARLSGSGQSTPVVWGDRIFFLAVASTDEGAYATGRPDATEQPRGIDPPPRALPEVALDFQVVCLDRATGGVVWIRTAASAIPHALHHPAGSYAPHSAVTDGEYVWAGIGSRGLYCIDVEGNPQWGQPLDPMRVKFDFGEGSSPVLAGPVVAVVQDHEGPSRIHAFDKDTGEVRWRRERDEGSSWSTPVAVEVGGRWQVVTAATNRIRSYDAVTGEIVWETDGLTNNTIPSPVPGDGVVYCSSNFKQFSMKAIALGHAGLLDGPPGVLWTLEEATSYIATPVLADDRLYFVEDIKPLLSCADARTGALLYTRQRLRGLRQIFASPVAAGGRIYIVDRGGATAVVAQADHFEILAVNRLDDGFDASPVVAGDSLLLKGHNYLYCIASE
ncbi:MAG: PQQ-binding-like beta-propeller repeat protein [Candidatus Hydrogenedentes bacterium]|nr:PQQ-binding-like beta-propeller repeat protein [Candidatus Hydrogenedentota bacterium]